jgi:hypothetical protein
VALVDQDDVWLKGKLARARRRLNRLPPDRPALYAAESVLVDAQLRPLARSRAPGAAPSFGNALVQNLCSGHTMALNAAAVALARQAGMPSGIHYHDWWLYQLVAGAGGALCLDRLPVALYRQHAANALGAAHGPRAALIRAARLARGDWGGAMRAHGLALRKIAPLLTPAARKVLDAYLDDFPGRGAARAMAFRDHGLLRMTRADRFALQISACFGRV